MVSGAVTTLIGFESNRTGDFLTSRDPFASTGV
jgi:hypothetical protein